MGSAVSVGRMFAVRIVDGRTGSIGHTVSTAEEAGLALSAAFDERLRCGLRHDLWRYEDRSDNDGERRTVGDVAAATAVLGAAQRPMSGGWRFGRNCPMSAETLLDPFMGRNVFNWPVTVEELRGDAALADADLDELAAHLNTRLRGDIAAVLRECADFGARRHDRRKFNTDEPEEDETVWDCFRRGSDLYELSLSEVVDAIRCGPVSWEPLDEWTPTGGVDGNPFMVCRYVWGPLAASVQLEARELLDVHLAGDADVTLYRIVVDVGEGPVELIWPEQRRTCCGQSQDVAGTSAPIQVTHWGRPDVEMYAGGRRCPVCGAAHYGSLLVRRALGDSLEPLGVVAEIDALPAATLAAIACDAANAVTGDLPRKQRRREAEARR